MTMALSGELLGAYYDQLTNCTDVNPQVECPKKFKCQRVFSLIRFTAESSIIQYHSFEMFGYGNAFGKLFNQSKLKW